MVLQASHQQPSNRRDRLRGLRKQMKEELGHRGRRKARQLKTRAARRSLFTFISMPGFSILGSRNRLSEDCDAEDTGDESEEQGDPSQTDGHSTENSKKGPFTTLNTPSVVQEIKAEHTGAVWVVRFSVCGRLMATAGQDTIIRIWVAKAHVRHFEALRDRYMKRADCPPEDMFERAMSDSEVFRAPSSVDAESDHNYLQPIRLKIGEKDQSCLLFFPFVVLKSHTADTLDLF
ncbi:unnamed protein product, partial [Mesorhabditis spiculigera]